MTPVWIMSHDVQLNPAAPILLPPPCHLTPSSPSAEQPLRRRRAVAHRRTEAAGQARDSATPQKSGLCSHFSWHARDPGRDRRRGGTDSHGHARFPAFSPQPRLEPRRGPGIARRADARQAARTDRLDRLYQAHRVTCRASPAAACQPGLLTAIGPRCTSDVPAFYLTWTCAAVGWRPAPATTPTHPIQAPRAQARDDLAEGCEETARALAKAWTRGWSNRIAEALRPSVMRDGCAIRAKTGLARTQAWSAHSV